MGSFGNKGWEGNADNGKVPEDTVSGHESGPHSGPRSGRDMTCAFGMGDLWGMGMEYRT
jgi:hypothetical protein